jgi:hypothetical protein
MRIGSFSLQPGVLTLQDVRLADASLTEKRDNRLILIRIQRSSHEPAARLCGDPPMPIPVRRPILKRVDQPLPRVASAVTRRKPSSLHAASPARSPKDGKHHNAGPKATQPAARSRPTAEVQVCGAAPYRLPSA